MAFASAPGRNIRAHCERHRGRVTVARALAPSWLGTPGDAGHSFAPQVDAAEAAAYDAPRLSWFRELAAEGMCWVGTRSCISCCGFMILRQAPNGRRTVVLLLRLSERCS